MDKIGTLHAPDALCLRQLIGQARNPENGNVYEVSIMPGGMPHVLSRVAGLQWSASWEELIALAIEAGVDRAPMDAADTPFPGLSLEPPAVASDRWPESPTAGFSRAITGTLARRHSLVAEANKAPLLPPGAQFCIDAACPICAQFDREMAAAAGRPPFRMGDRIRYLQDLDPRRPGVVNFDDGRQILIRWDDAKDAGLQPFSYEDAVRLLRLETAEEQNERTRERAQIAPPEGLVLTPGPATSGAVAKGAAAPAPAAPPHPFQDQNDACSQEGCGAARRQHDPNCGPGWISHPFEERPAPSTAEIGELVKTAGGFKSVESRHNTDLDPLEAHLRTDDCWRCGICGDEQEEGSHAAPCKRAACSGAYVRFFRDPKAQAAQEEGGPGA